jgi:hypothetical protein
LNEKLKKLIEKSNEIHSISHAPSTKAYGVLLFQKVHSLKESAARTTIHIMMQALLLAEV